MSVLSGKNILLGVTAGIAAYKSAFLVRLLVKSGASVKVVMTPSAKEFPEAEHAKRVELGKRIAWLK